jgi:Saxitoxin biosynthesis operon protein SxtJ
MQWSDIPFQPSRRTLRQFASLWFVFFTGLACWQGFARGRVGLAFALGALAVSVGLLGLMSPQRVRLVYVGWMVLVFPIGWTVSTLLLAALFYAVFTPVGLLFKLVGRDALARRPRRWQDTYWAPKGAAADVRGYFRQF